MLTIDGQKMSKSLGNFVTLKDAFKVHDPTTVRYFIAASHYRSVVDYTENALQTAGTSLKRLHQTVRTLRERLPENSSSSGQWFTQIQVSFNEAMDDDFSTPQAFAALFDLNREVNTMLASAEPNPDAVADAERLFSVI